MLKKIFDRIIGLLKSYKLHKKQPIHLEFVLSDFCNLNCKGCTHYSPIAPKEYTPLDILKVNMEHLSNVLKDNVIDIYLIGGEPLIVPNLIDVIALTREYFSQSNIFIFTNGLLLPKMDEVFWNTCRSCNISIAITRYPIKFDYDAAIRRCESENVKYSVFGDRSLSNSFFRFGLDETKSQNKYISHFKCYNRGCISIVEDKIFPCSISACINHVNNKFGTSFKHEKSDFIYVKDVKHISQIKSLRDRPVPFCRYCVLPPVTVEYGPSKREKSEWIDG